VSKPKAQEAYRKFVSQGRGVTVWENVRGQVYLGCDAFIEEHAPALLPAGEIPRAQVQVTRPPLSALVTDPQDVDAIAHTYLDHRYTQQEIANHLGVHYSTISRRMQSVEKRGFRKSMRDCRI